MNVESNNYTIGFSIVMAVIVAFLLAAASNGLSGFQKANEKHEKIVNLFSAIGEDIAKMEKPKAEELFNEKFDGFRVNNKGDKTGNRDDAFSVDMAKESKKNIDEQNLPVFIYKADNGAIKYVLQSRGNGLWDAIWMYVAIEEDMNTISGAVFDHKGETPGLGAEIKDSKDFYGQFAKGKTLFSGNGDYIGVKVLKGTGNDLAKGPNMVDGITGATMTCNGVTDMFKDKLVVYANFLKSNKN